MYSLLQTLNLSCLVFSCLLAFTQAETPIRECNNNKPIPLMVQVNDCAELPCDFFKNNLTQMAIQFVATKDILLKVRASVKITALGIEMPFELSEERSDVCKNLMFGANCPLYKGEDVTYHLMWSFSENQPEIPIKVEVKLMDDLTKEVITCFIVDGRVKKSDDQLIHGSLSLNSRIL